MDAVSLHQDLMCYVCWLRVLDREPARQQMCSDTKCWRVRSQQTFYSLVTDVRQRREKSTYHTTLGLGLDIQLQNAVTWRERRLEMRWGESSEDQTTRKAWRQNMFITEAFVKDVFGRFAQIWESRRDSHCICWEQTFESIQCGFYNNIVQTHTLEIHHVHIYLIVGTSVFTVAKDSRKQELFLNSDLLLSQPIIDNLDRYLRAYQDWAWGTKGRSNLQYREWLVSRMWVNGYNKHHE